MTQNVERRSPSEQRHPASYNHLEGERKKGIFPSQPVANPEVPRPTASSSAQINAIHTLRSRKKVDNQVVMPDQTNSSPLKSVPSSSGSDKSEVKEIEQVTKLHMNH